MPQIIKPKHRNQSELTNRYDLRFDLMNAKLKCGDESGRYSAPCCRIKTDFFNALIVSNGALLDRMEDVE